MDISELRKDLKQRIENDHIRKRIKKSIEDYKVGRRETALRSVQQYRTILSSQKELKDIIDKKQTDLINKLEGNQLALTSGFKDIIESNRDIIKDLSS